MEYEDAGRYTPFLLFSWSSLFWGPRWSAFIGRGPEGMGLGVCKGTSIGRCLQDACFLSI